MPLCKYHDSSFHSSNSRFRRKEMRSIFHIAYVIYHISYAISHLAYDISQTSLPDPQLLCKVHPMTRFTRRLSLHLGCLLLLCLAGDAAVGSDDNITLSNKQPVVIKIPRKLLKY